MESGGSETTTGRAAPRATPHLLDGPTLGRLAVRAVILDFLIRFALAAALAFGNAGIDPVGVLRPGPPFAPESLAVASAAGAVVCLDMVATRERIFLAHLGIGLRHAFGAGVAAAAAAEAVAALLLPLVGSIFR